MLPGLQQRILRLLQPVDRVVDLLDRGFEAVIRLLHILRKTVLEGLQTFREALHVQILPL